MKIEDSNLETNQDILQSVDIRHNLLNINLISLVSTDDKVDKCWCCSCSPLQDCCYELIRTNGEAGQQLKI